MAYYGGVEEEVVANWSKHDFLGLQQLMTFYLSRLDAEPAGTIVSLSNVANSVKTKVLHKTILFQELPFENVCIVLHCCLKTYLID